MALALVFALMTAAAIFAVLRPLARRSYVASGSGVAVYRDQLDEIDRDRAAGLIAEPEAQAARVEVSRRLIGAADAEQIPPTAATAASSWPRRSAAIVALLILPAVAALIYLRLGSPGLPGEPLAARASSPADTRSIESLVSQVEAHIERNPDDGRGWEVLAPVYLKLGRTEDAVKARRRALELNGVTAEREADLGEALAAAANGVVTTDAKAAFDRAVALDQQHLKSRYYLGIAAEQDGNGGDAANIWRGMLAGAAADAPWVPRVREALARVAPDAAPPPGPNAQDVAAASAMTGAQRAEMIEGMVARLSERLTQDGSDVEGWLRLMRAYIVLGDRGKALAAATDARHALAGDPDKLRRVDEFVKGLGLEG